MNAITLRLARASDLADVHRIYMHEAVIDYLGYDPMSLAEFVPVFEEMVASQAFHIAVKREGEVEVLLGFCRLIRNTGRAAHRAYLGTFAIDPKHSGQGHGQAVIRSLAAMLQTQGVRRLELMMEADNARAERFYQRLGFVQEGRLREAYKRGHQAHYVDEVLFVLNLA